MDHYFSIAKGVVPVILVMAAAISALVAINKLLERRFRDKPEKMIFRQLLMVVLTLASLLVVVLVLPVSETVQGHILSLLGIVLSAAIALSSTTFLGNALAGILLRSVRSFRSGDFVRVGDHFGRVSGRGLFHVELQTEDRDLTTLPNLFLATNPVKVTHASGTIVSAEVSLGYDIPRMQVEELLVQAASAADLQEPFVYILQLGDFSVLYRVSGLLQEVSQLLSARSKLHARILDTLHDAAIEIVSPNFMNTRVVTDQTFIPRGQPAPVDLVEETTPETIVFDKAEKAEAVEKMKARMSSLEKKLETLKEQEKTLESDKEKALVEKEVTRLERARERLAERILQCNEESDKN